jgi:hypothetical protein
MLRSPVGASIPRHRGGKEQSSSIAGEHANQIPESIVDRDSLSESMLIACWGPWRGLARPERSALSGRIC